MKVKLNLGNIIIAGMAQIGNASFEYEGTVQEIKESIELLPTLMEQYKVVEGMLVETPEVKEPTPTTNGAPKINLAALETLGITKESLEKLFQGGK